MKLTCVTAVYNAIKSGNRDRLIKCVESVAALKTEHEHLIYDGASTDGTTELLRELEKRTPSLKVTSEPDTGIYNALNKGVRDAKGAWFYVLGCDDFLCCPDVMDRILNEEVQYCDIFATSVRIVDQTGSLLVIMRPNLSELFNHPCACHQGEIMRTSIARQLGGFDERYRIAADSDMFLKAHLRPYMFRYSREVFAEFTACGASGDCRASELEHRTSVANVLGLSGADRELLLKNKVLSFRVCRQLWHHPDIVVRRAARAMVFLRVKKVIRIMLYPFIVASRPLRRKLGYIKT